MDNKIICVTKEEAEVIKKNSIYNKTSRIIFKKYCICLNFMVY